MCLKYFIFKKHFSLALSEHIINIPSVPFRRFLRFPLSGLVEFHSLHLAFHIRQGLNPLMRHYDPPLLGPRRFLAFTLALPSLDLMFQPWGPKLRLMLSCPFVLACVVFLAGISLSLFPGYTNPTPLPSIACMHASIHPLLYPPTHPPTSIHPSIHPASHPPVYPFTEPLVCARHIQPTQIYSATNNHNFHKIL